MAKIIKNTTGSAINIADTGVTIAASPAQYIIPTQDYSLWAASSDVLKPLADGDLLFNDGSNDYDGTGGFELSFAVDIIKDMQCLFVDTSSNGLVDVVPDANSIKRFAVDVLTRNEQIVASVTTPFSPWLTKNGSSSAVPFSVLDFKTYPNMHDATIFSSGTATGTQSTTTLQDTSKTWGVNALVGYTVKLTGGTGAGQWRKIVSNTSNTLTVGTWGTTPVSASTTYEITALSTRLVAPIDSYYEIDGHASIAYQAGVVGIQFWVNGAFKTVHYEHQSASIELHAQHSKMFWLNAGDYVEMIIYNGNGSHQTVFGGSARLWFQMKRA